MSDIIQLLAIFFTGISIFSFSLFLSRIYGQLMVSDESTGAMAAESSKRFPEKLKLYQLLVRWRVKSRIRLIPNLFKQKINSLWTRSGNKPKEQIYFIAKLEIIILSGFLILIAITILTGSLAFAIFVALPIALYWIQIYLNFLNSVEDRLSQIERELPYFLDLLAMMLYGGGNIFIAFQSLTSMPVKTPLTDELRAVTQSLRMGKSFSEGLRAFSERVGSETVNSVVLSVEQGERLGTPLHQVLKSQAHTIRSKRILAAEEHAQRAGVKIFIPASLVMLALMIILLTPSIIKMFSSVK